MEPLLISVADAARVLGLSTSTIGSLAATGTIPSLRIGKRVLLPVKALEEWIEGRLAEDADRYRASWTGIRAYATAAPARTKGRGYPGRRSW
jgi:excisionase family DNA binding protein